MEEKIAKHHNKYGLSKKTNMVLGCVAAIALAKDSSLAIIMATIVALVGIISQHILDSRGKS